jgi:hypothetical protein
MGEYTREMIAAPAYPRWKLWGLLVACIAVIGLLLWAMTIPYRGYRPDCGKSRAVFDTAVGDSVLAFYANKTAQYNALTAQAKKIVIRDHLCYNDALLTWAVGN